MKSTCVLLVILVAVTVVSGEPHFKGKGFGKKGGGFYGHPIHVVHQPVPVYYPVHYGGYGGGYGHSGGYGHGGGYGQSGGYGYGGGYGHFSGYGR
ncbi:keratin-associated protein 19-2-like [Scylla paramamosain]|uniref:keratin-associated protein 19-2-like n=1 Tax=Scylla paramamosain TaxID=85552 RepID=UPI0030830ED2